MKCFGKVTSVLSIEVTLHELRKYVQRWNFFLLWLGLSEHVCVLIGCDFHLYDSKINQTSNIKLPFAFRCV